MKQNKRIRTIVLILAIVLVALVSFEGVYAEDKNTMKNMVREYSLGREFLGSRRVVLKVSEKTTKTNYDKDGKVIESSDTTTEVANTIENPVNPAETKKKENYQTSKKVIEARLKQLKVEDYTIRLDESNGTIVLELPEKTTATDSIISTVTQQGKFEIQDSTTQEVLLNNSDIESVTANIGSVSTGYVAYIAIQFNKEGIEKFKNITGEYKSVATNTTNETEGEQTKAEKKVTLKLDGETIMTDSFDKPVTDGLLKLTIGKASTTTNSEDLLNSYQTAQVEATVLNSGSNPLVYTLEQNKYVTTDITSEMIEMARMIAIVVVAIGILYLIFRYRKSGILFSFAFLGYIALLLVVLRYANVTLAINGMVAIGLSAILEFAFLLMLGNKEKEIEDKKQVYRKTIENFAKTIVPIIIIAVVFTFSGSLSIFSFGMVLFWAIVIHILYNAVVTRTLLLDSGKEDRQGKEDK